MPESAREESVIKSDIAPTTVDERKRSKKKSKKGIITTFSAQQIAPNDSNTMPDFNPGIVDESHADILDQSMLLKKQMHYNHKKKVDP